MIAPLPKNEEARLKALHDYELLDTAPERDYDDLVALASRICGCEMSTITLVDRNRQWFKAAVGMAVRETSRDLALCAHAILEPDKMFVVPDMLNDARFSTESFVTNDPHIRFYAGMPMTDSQGATLGTLCVMDRKPGKLTGEQREALEVLARQATRLMELRRASAALARALTEVKVLEGLLPTCCGCKAIRDERGEWQSMEHYMVQRTAANFTHGICPTCAKRLYPDLDLSGVKP